jgi:hypothetical protein
LEHMPSHKPQLYSTEPFSTIIIFCSSLPLHSPLLRYCLTLKLWRKTTANKSKTFPPSQPPLCPSILPLSQILDNNDPS